MKPSGPEQMDLIAVSRREALAAARAKGESGAERAADHAERVTPEWKAEAFESFVTFSRNASRPFLTEEVVKAYAGVIAAPPDARAWGQVARRASREGYVRKWGFAPAVTSHGSPKILWVANRHLPRSSNVR